MQYDMLADAAYTMTSDDLIVAVLATRKGLGIDDWAAFRADYFSKGQPCLRVSPLVKTMGWAIHHDSDSKVALVDVASPRSQNPRNAQQTRIRLIPLHGARRLDFGGKGALGVGWEHHRDQCQKQQNSHRDVERPQSGM